MKNNTPQISKFAEIYLSNLDLGVEEAKRVAPETVEVLEANLTQAIREVYFKKDKLD